jgi:G3E family GTPase
MKNTKLYILTGFLGSGKTTVLLELCRQLKDSRVGVIQNELGKINIDGTILRNDDVRMVEISRGSIFCTCLMQNFIDTLAEMSKMSARRCGLKTKIFLKNRQH